MANRVRVGFVLAVVSLVCSLGQARAGTALFEFETDAEVAAWTMRTPATDALTRSSDFASEGVSSMLFTTPKWTEGMEQWPAFEARPPVTDWRGFDRLAMDVTNPAADAVTVRLFVSDSDTPFREGLSASVSVPSGGFARAEVPLSFPEAVNPADIAIIHVFLERPAADVTLHLDSMTLLQPGETLPDPPPGFVRQVAGLSAEGLGFLEARIAGERDALLAAAGTAEARRGIAARVRAVSERVAEVRRTLASEALTLEELGAARAEAEILTRGLSRIADLTRLETEFDSLGLGGPMLVGFATSMEKIPPRDQPFRVTPRSEVEVSLARNEEEAFQVVVTPREGALEGVAVSVSDLWDPVGHGFPAEGVECEVVGYVETKSPPPYDVDYVGWWPDPILDFLGPVDIAEGDVQSFWVRVRADEGQLPGTYRGVLRVSAKGAKTLEFPLAVTVRSFTLPRHTPLPTAITFFEPYEQIGGEERWPELKMRYADFLADYYIDYDSLYRQGPPDFEILKRLHDTGRLTAFNLGNVLNGGADEASLDATMAGIIEGIRPGYEKAKELGILDHAYIYGFDERGQDQFALLERAAKALREAFPDVVLMTTSYDHSYGMESVVKTIDAWCPLTPSFDPEKAEEARAQGKHVWWYICCGPHHPYANWFVEYPALDARLLHGAMTAKQRPDGFLYYALTIWNENRPIDSGPFTEWNPVSWTVYHGDGSLFHCGPDGGPLPSIRLENHRDGMEDYAYVCILEEAIRRVEAATGADGPRRRWLAEAKEALVPPETLVRSMTEYSRDPAELYAWRERVARLIERSGLRDLDPWGGDFGVRGFPDRAG